MTENSAGASSSPNSDVMLPASRSGDRPRCVSPADMPRRVRSCSHPSGAHAPRHWVLVERLGDIAPASVVVDGRYPRRFANLYRSTIASQVGVARRLPALIDRCVVGRRIEIDQAPLACGASVNIVAAPIFGPYGHVRAVALCAGAAGDPLPLLPNVGVVEWDAAVVVSASASAGALLLDGRCAETLMLPEMLSCFERFDDRSGFLALLRKDDPIDHWTGCATRTFGDGSLRRLHIVARASGAGLGRCVRAVVCDTTEVEPPASPDMYSSALRHVPVLPGHALALIDLSAMVIHDWVANDRDLLAGWAHHQPLLHPVDQAFLHATGAEMLTGAKTTADVPVRVRFDPADDWIQLQSRWTRIVSGGQPQVLADIEIVLPMPPSVLDGCARCQGISSGAA